VVIVGSGAGAGNLTLIYVGAGKFLGARRIFAQISPNLPEKTSKENAFQKKNDCISFHFGRIFSNQTTSSNIFAKLSNFP